MSLPFAIGRLSHQLEPDACRTTIERATELGATTVMFVFHRERDPAALERLARAVL